MAVLHAHERRFSIENFVRLEQHSNVRHELIDGQIFAVAGAFPTHGALAANVSPRRSPRQLDYPAAMGPSVPRRRRAFAWAASAALLMGFALEGCATMDREPGEPCEHEGDCVAGASCAVVSQSGGVDTYACVSRCDELGSGGGFPELCPGGEVCWYLRGDRPDWRGCFPGGAVPLGGECTYPVECERGGYCVGTSDEAGVCAPVCPAEGCSEGEPCQIGDCAEGLACALVAHPSSFANTACVPTCTSPDPASDTPTLCPGGEACFLLDDAIFAWGCYPGGDLPIGAPCEGVSQCVRGAVCWDLGDGPACVPACADDEDCPTGACTAGLCQP